MSFLCFNGKILNAHLPLFTAQNRSFRYGDGVFETMKIFKGQILLKPYHFDRLFAGLALLKMNPGNLPQKELEENIVQVCMLNGCIDLGRVRLAVYREEDASVSYVIEAFPLANTTNDLNENGWVIDLYPHARKSQDAFANLKTANYLPYVLAEKHAQENSFDECLLLNSENNVCDASKANVFLFTQNEVYTPALHQGCVSGTMRRFVIDELKRLEIPVHQTAITTEHLLEAEEVFLTNAINGMRWVKRFRQKNYSNKFIKEIHHKIFYSVYY